MPDSYVTGIVGDLELAERPISMLVPEQDLTVELERAPHGPASACHFTALPTVSRTLARFSAPPNLSESNASSILVGVRLNAVF